MEEISVNICQEYGVLAAILTEESHASLLQSFCRPTSSSFELHSKKKKQQLQWIVNELNSNELFSLQYIPEGSVTLNVFVCWVTRKR